MSGHEVVKVVYDKEQLKKKELDKYAIKSNCNPLPEDNDYRIDKDPQYYLKKSKYKYLPLSSMQKTKINAALAKGGNPTKLLSPTQALWLSEDDATDVLYTKDLQSAWREKINN